MVESQTPPTANDELVTLQRGVAALQGSKDVQVLTRATIRNMNVSRKYSCRTCSCRLDPAYYMLLQNFTYEVLLEARQKMVGKL